MNAQDCPACGASDAVEEEWDDVEGYDLPATCKCDECGARFEIDPDADFDGEDFRDCSTVGDRIEDES